MAVALLHIRKHYLEHVPPCELRDLTTQCVLFCQGANIYLLGGTSDGVMQQIGDVAASAGRAYDKVCDAIKDGRLVERDGRIINPNPIPE